MSNLATQPTIIFLMGATASGKTDLAIQLAQEYNCEIISVDSAMIYKDMNIGTAKPSNQELILAPHRLINIIPPTMHYSIANFIEDALSHIQQILALGKIPLLVGGTMMYFKNLLTGLSALPTSNAEIRKYVLAQAEQHGWQYLHQQLNKLDPITASRLHINDSQRIGRALEVCLITGKPFSELIISPKQRLPYQVKQFAIQNQRDVLHQKIELRLQQMLTHGFVDEVVMLRNKYQLNLDLPAMRCVGYRQIWQYLDNEYNYDEMVYRSLCATRQLAKRQLTWLRNWSFPLIWLDPTMQQLAEKIITTIKKD